jgi:hypothetical protein
MKIVKLCFLGLAICGFGGRLACAANYSISAQVFSVLDASTLTALSSIPDLSSTNLPSPHIVGITFTLHASGYNSAANQRGFGNLWFDINLTGNSLESVPVGSFPAGWIASNPLVDTNGSNPGGSLQRWFANEDTGNPADMKDILLDLPFIPTPHPDDPRPHVGEAPGTVIGSSWIYWDGMGPETLSVTGVFSAGQLQASFTRIDNGQLQIDTAGIFNTSTLTMGVVPNNGDFDLDGDIDGADFVAWQVNYPTTSGATRADGDADFDGDVDGNDFAIWQTNFGTSSSLSSAAAVPEPAAWMLLAIGSLICCRRCK